MFTSALKTFFGSGVVATVTDAFFNLVTLLLPGNGTNGAQNNTFLDSSSNNFTITRNGNTTQGTFSPFSQTGWSNYFDGSSTINFTQPALNSVFTIEFWAWIPSAPSNVFFYVAATNAPLIGYNVSTFSIGRQGSWPIASSTNPMLNQWNHIALVREGTGTNQYKLYINGSLTGTGTESATIGSQSATIGGAAGGSRITAYISNFRIVSGTALYTTTFTPPTAPLTDITNTELLTCQSNRLVDANTQVAAKTFTFTGSPSVQAFSPFLPTAAYSAATVGGSGFFDGTGDYLETPNNAALALGSSDFSVEWWEYRTTLGAEDTAIQAPGTTGFLFNYYDVGFPRFFLSTSSGSYNVLNNAATGAISANTWNHFVVTRSGTAFRVFLNGVLSIYATGSGSVVQPSNNFMIGGGSQASVNFPGYISNVRVVRGSIPTSYQTSNTTTNTSIFTSPTAPLTTTSQGATSGDVRLLLNMTNAGITDATAKNVLETVGNASISTTQSKFGGSSMFFDGTGDYLSATPRIQSNAVGSGNATIEMWVYTSNSSSSLKCLVDTRSAQNTDTGFGIYQIANNVVIYGAGVKGNAASQLTGNAWVHLAVTRANTTNYVFIGGTLYNTFSYGNTLTSSNVTIGSDVVGSNAFTGYIDDLRITNGVARYTANFTPTTTAFPLQ